MSDKPSPSKTLALVGAAFVLFTLAVAVPRMRAKAMREAAGRAGPVVLELKSGGRPLSEARAGDPIDLRYDAGDYLYLWIVAVDEGGQLTPFFPAREAIDSGPGFAPNAGHPTRSGGESIAKVGVAGDARVLYALFSAVPVGFDDLQKAAAALPKTGGAESIARAMPFRGEARVVVLHPAK